MKIATFNANSIRSRLDVVVAWLNRHQPDVLCLQETKVMDELFPAAPLRAAGYHVAFRGEKAYNGVALLSRREPTDVRYGLDDGGPADAARLVAATIDGVHIINTYVPQGREIDHAMYPYKQAWFGRLRAFFDRHYAPGAPVIWLGDLNVAPTPIDVHNPQEQLNHVCYHEAVRKVYADTVDWGFEDVFRRHHPEAGHYSYFDYRMPNALQRKLGWRIDHILATPSLAKACTEAWIDLEPRLQPKSSDHTFVVAQFAT